MSFLVASHVDAIRCRVGRVLTAVARRRVPPLAGSFVAASVSLGLVACTAGERGDEPTLPRPDATASALSAPAESDGAAAPSAVETPPASIAAGGAGPTPDAYLIPLPSGATRPDAQDSSVIAASFEARLKAVGGERAHVIIQLRTAPEAADIERLAAGGITLLEPLTRTTWYASITQGASAALTAESGLRWTGVVDAADKLAAGAASDEAPPEYQKRPEGRLAYLVLFHGDVAAAEVVALAHRLDAGLESFDEPSFPIVRTATFILPSNKLPSLAESDIVQRVEPPPAPNQDENVGSAQPLSNVDVVQAAPFNLNGSNVIVGVWEAGGRIDGSQLDLNGRVNVQPSQTPTLTDHASHVAGTIGASGVNIPQAEGMAPNVTLSSWDADLDAAEMAAAAVGTGAGLPVRVTNHSYGEVIGWDLRTNPPTYWTNQAQFGRYSPETRGFDNVVAQRQLVVVKSAGNDRTDAPAVPTPGQPADCTQGGLGVAADCIGPKGVAKNIITVGAMNGANTITTFSSFGPTDDGRIKPDLVAQGANMLSLASSNFFTDAPPPDGIDDVPDSTTASTTMSGTSMAAPVVSGIVALVLQDAAANSIALTAAAVKALLIHTARDVAGTGQATTGPDYATGWGIADAQAAVDTLRDRCLTQATLAKTGAANAWSQSFYVPKNLPELRITLVWTDPAGVVGGQILRNDLDLRLISPGGATFLPWTLNPTNPGQAAVRNGGNDAVNNVEQVSVLNPASGVWTARVSAGAGRMPLAPQAFAIACLPVNAAPAVEIGPNRVGIEGDPIAFTATVTDADVDDDHFVTFDWGDGSVERLPVEPSGQVDRSHRWGDNGTFTVKATVEDYRHGYERGGVGTDSLQVVVNNVTPTGTPPAISPIQPWPGQTVALAGTFVDPGWLDTHSFDVDWDDNTPHGTGTPTKAHLKWDEVGTLDATKPDGYAVPDTYDVALCVKDDDGATGCANSTLRVELSPDMPGIVDTDLEWNFLQWTGALPGSVAAGEEQWRKGTGVAKEKWIYEADGWLYFFQATTNDVPNFDPDQDESIAHHNWLAIAVPKADFQTWLWCGISVPDGHGGTKIGCHPNYSPPPDGDGTLHPWVTARIVESRPHIFAVLHKLFD